MKRGQSYRAVKTKVAGHAAIGLPEDEHLYDSKLEAKCAEILLRHGIKFKPHVKFECFDREGKTFFYTVDFLFDEPQKLKGISTLVNAIEVKGYLRSEDFLRIDALKFRHHVRTWIVAANLVDLWDREGMRGEASVKNKRPD